VGPHAQLGGVAGAAVLPLCGVGERVHQTAPLLVVDHGQQLRAGAACGSGHGVDVGAGDGTVVEPAPVGPANGDRRTQASGRGVGIAGPVPDGRQVAAVLRVGKPVGGGAQAECRQRDEQVVQRRAAAEHQIATVRIGGGQVPVPVRVQLDRLRPDPPAPGLGVVHRRRSGRLFDGAGDLGGAEHDRLRA
jgi:hypothetical protein